MEKITLGMVVWPAICMFALVAAVKINRWMDEIDHLDDHPVTPVYVLSDVTGKTFPNGE